MNAVQPVPPIDPAAHFMKHLRETGVLSQSGAEKVLRIQQETLDRLPAILLKLGLISESVLAQQMAAFSGCAQAAEFSKSRVLPADVGVVESFLRAHEVVPLESSPISLTMACWETLDPYVARAVAFAAERPVVWKIATRSQIQAALSALEANASDEHTRLADALIEEDEVDRLKDLASEAPVIRLVQRLIEAAVQARASDIHVEASEEALHVRLRLDGLLREVERHPKSMAGPVISRLKVMAGLNIAERRLPQDGRIRTSIDGKEIDFRVATSPTLHGEAVVLRILDRQDVALDFIALGFDVEVQEILRSAISRPHGIVLVTGPTGSGKTTTLYAALKEINTPDKKILTVEDPVEYMLAGVNQVPIKPQIGLTFANALRSFLRQDPDVMMVGEIRDRETAEIAIQAALTGHLLLSTLHTNTAAAAITRLLDMGIDDYLLTSTLHLIVAQRLVRKLCEQCKEPYALSAEVHQRFSVQTQQWYRPVGCSDCRSGYKGRTTILEMLVLSDEIRAKVLERTDAQQIEQVAVAQGMRTLFRHGIDRVTAGLTSIEEVLRVTNVS